MSPRPNKNSFEGKWNLVQLEGIAQTNLILTGIHYAHVQILHTSGSYECLLPDILSNILYGYMDPKWAAQSGQGNLLLNLSKKIWGGHWHPDIPTCPVCPCVSVYDGSTSLHAPCHDTLDTGAAWPHGKETSHWHGALKAADLHPYSHDYD